MRNYSALVGAMLILVAAGCKSGNTEAAGTQAGASKDVKKLTKLGTDDTVVGKGQTVADGDEVWVLYTGKLANGHIFDSNDKEGGSPFHVTVGHGEVIKGWDKGLVGMKEGGKRKLSIPSELAYGSKSQNGIPPDSDLYFDVELKQVLKPNNSDVITANDVKNGKGAEAKDGSVVTVSYTVTVNGDEIETQKGIRFKIGSDQVAIPGFDQAVIGMKVGGERTVSIPPRMTRLVHNEKLGMNVGVWHVKLDSVD